MPAVAFRFDRAAHEYIDLATGQILPHITGMLEAEGLVDDLWFTEESSDRGTAVHRLTADYDLGALDLASCVSPFRGYLAGHAKAMSILRPEILSVEEPKVHPRYQYGGRPDRVARLVGRRVGVLEIKSGAPAKSHAIQTALQAILVADAFELPAHQVARYCLYLKPTGRFVLEAHERRHDFTEAERIIRACCR